MNYRILIAYGCLTIQGATLANVLNIDQPELWVMFITSSILVAIIGKY